MNTRIRYNKQQNDGSFESVRTYLTNDGQMISILIHTIPNLIVHLVSSGSNPIIHTSTGFKTLQDAKVGAKSALIAYGVNFQPEVRTRLSSVEKTYYTEREAKNG